MIDIFFVVPKTTDFDITIYCCGQPSAGTLLTRNFRVSLAIDDFINHYNDVIMGAMASQITSLTTVYSTVYSGADQRKHKSCASLAFVWGIHRRPVNSPHKWPVTRKMFPFDDVIMLLGQGPPLLLIFVVVNFDALAQASDLRIERREIVFLWWMEDSNFGNPRHQIASRLSDHLQTDWAIEDQAINLNSIARPYDEWAFRPLDFTAAWLSHLALTIFHKLWD